MVARMDAGPELPGVADAAIGRHLIIEMLH